MWHFKRRLEWSQSKTNTKICIPLLSRQILGKKTLVKNGLVAKLPCDDCIPELSKAGKHSKGVSSSHLVHSENTPKSSLRLEASQAHSAVYKLVSYRGSGATKH